MKKQVVANDVRPSPMREARLHARGSAQSGLRGADGDALAKSSDAGILRPRDESARRRSMPATDGGRVSGESEINGSGEMTTRKYAAIAERLDRLADQMRDTAIVIGGNRSVTPARPHIIGAARTAKDLALMLRRNLAESDRALYVANQIDCAVETLREWADTQPDRRLDSIRANSLAVMARFVSANAQELRS